MHACKQQNSDTGIYVDVDVEEEEEKKRGVMIEFDNPDK